MEDVDVLLRVYHTAIKTGALEIGDHDKLDELLERAQLSRTNSRDGSPVKPRANGTANGIANGVH